MREFRWSSLAACDTSLNDRHELTGGVKTNIAWAKDIEWLTGYETLCCGLLNGSRWHNAALYSKNSQHRRFVFVFKARNLRPKPNNNGQRERKKKLQHDGEWKNFFSFIILESHTTISLNDRLLPFFLFITRWLGFYRFDWLLGCFFFEFFFLFVASMIFTSDMGLLCLIASELNGTLKNLKW